MTDIEYDACPLWRRHPAALALLLLWIGATWGLCLALSMLGVVDGDTLFAGWIVLVLLYPVCIEVLDRRWENHHG